MKYLLYIVLAFFLNGCLYFNDRGVSTEYYNECREYYDSMGIYHKDCGENIVDYKDLNPKNLVKEK